MAHLLKTGNTHCDKCQEELAKDGVLVTDLGTVTLPAKFSFCSRTCRSQMICDLLKSNLFDEAGRKKVAAIAPDAYAQHLRTQSGGSKPINTALQEQAPSTAPIGTHLGVALKRTLGGNPYVVDTTAIAEEIICRLDHYGVDFSQKLAELDTEATALMDKAISLLAEKGFADGAAARAAFMEHYNAALTLEEASMAYWPPMVPATHKHLGEHDLHWSAIDLANELATLMRASLDPAAGAANHARMAIDIQTFVRRVVSERGDLGFSFLKRFPVNNA